MGSRDVFREQRRDSVLPGLAGAGQVFRPEIPDAPGIPLAVRVGLDRGEEGPRTSSRPTANARPSAQFQANAGDSGNPARREATGGPFGGRGSSRRPRGASNTA